MKNLLLSAATVLIATGASAASAGRYHRPA